MGDLDASPSAPGDLRPRTSDGTSGPRTFHSLINQPPRRIVVREMRHEELCCDGLAVGKQVHQVHHVSVVWRGKRVG